MKRRDFFIKIRNWHRYLALIVGVQVLFWTISGLFMSFVPIDDVRGSHLVKDKKQTAIRLGAEEAEVLKKTVSDLEGAGNSVAGVEIRTLLDQVVFSVATTSGQKMIYAASTGERVDPISKQLAEKIALSRYNGAEKVSSVELIKEPVIEYRSKYPVWRVDFAGGDESFYVDVDTGALKAVRTDLWRIYDFLWMLHIMDYQERDNFNHWWLVVFAAFGVLLTITGLIMIPIGFRWISAR